MCVTAIVVAGSLMVASKLQEAQAQADAQRRAAVIDEENARVSDALALDALRGGDLEAWKIRERGARLIGTQKVAFASGHIDPTSGSAAEVQAGTAAVTEFGAQIAKLNGMRAAYGYRAQGVNYRMTAGSRRAAASDVETAGYLSAIGSAASTYAAAGGSTGGGSPKLGVSYPSTSGVPNY